MRHANAPWRPARDWRSAVVTAALFACLPIAADAQSLPDPTEPTSTASVRGPGPAKPVAWILESTLVAEDRRIATINGSTLMVGDTVAGARVLEIEPFAVRLRTADGIIELSLSDDDPKLHSKGGTGP